MRTDGGTSFIWRGRRETWAPAFERLVQWMHRDVDAVEAEELREGVVVMLPLPTVADPWALPLGRDGVDLHELERRPDPRVLGFGWHDDKPVAMARLGERGAITFWIQDRAHVKVYQRADEDGEVRWECRVEAKARELYSDGLRSWMTRWLGLFGWCLNGVWCLPETAHDSGWKVSQWHLNGDVVGIDLVESDQRRLLGPRRYETHGLTGEADPDAVGDPWLQTLQWGSRASDVQLVIYRKGDQLREAKKVEPEASMYAPLWKANGWKPSEHGDPLRVEFRMRKKGLVYKTADKSRIAYDFRKPHMLLDEDATSEIWARLTRTRRIILDDSTRRNRCTTDPRWRIVQQMSSVGVSPDVRQQPREVRSLTRAERMAKSLHGAISIAVEYAAQNGAGVFSLERIGDVLVGMGERVREGGLEWIDETLSHGNLDIKRKVAAEKAKCGFFAREASSHYWDFTDKLPSRASVEQLFFRERTTALAYYWGNDPPRRDESVTENEAQVAEKLDEARTKLGELLDDESGEAVLFEQIAGALSMEPDEAAKAGVREELARAVASAFNEVVSKMGRDGFARWTNAVAQQAFGDASTGRRAVN